MNMHVAEVMKPNFLSRSRSRPRPRRRLSLILESSLTSNQRQHTTNDGHNAAPPPPRRNVSFLDLDLDHAPDSMPKNEEEVGSARFSSVCDNIDKSQRTQLTADTADSTIPPVIVIGGGEVSAAGEGGVGGGGGGGGSVGSFQSVLTADTQMLPSAAQQQQRYMMRTVVAGGSAMRVDVDLDATPAPGAPARAEVGPATPPPAAPRDRQRALLQHRTSVGPAHDLDAPSVGVG
eukprot:CAMPEP_0181059242 /NCGR_PEP_ID=MMETSP1070-20121207/21272_1 /TAXON_ID=265543 /ORGANISM="Minutocellus polymorphus, Strain NH13" /LENGTH=232 /DNA_ID=CAMNT_0023138895 /DNA_START=263 /DNA_END=958 /DNA_ORIENTATION=+